MGATFILCTIMVWTHVSIHAPVWVRPVWTVSCLGSKRFQFTHPCGCDPPLLSVLPAPACFNSRTRVGATCHGRATDFSPIVSIHAPVWVRPVWTVSCVGATYMRFRFLTPNKVSIHAPVWVRLGRRSYSASGILFQFTHPCGCDIPSPLKRYATLRFNSRTRVGATFCQAYGLPLYEVSIHAPVWVRLQRYAKPGSKCQFQFTHPCGCDARKMTLSCIGLVSIHAPVWVRPPSP